MNNDISSLEIPIIPRLICEQEVLGGLAGVLDLGGTSAGVGYRILDSPIRHVIDNNFDIGPSYFQDGITSHLSYKYALTKTPLQVYNNIEGSKEMGDRSNITIRKKTFEEKY